MLSYGMAREQPTEGSDAFEHFTGGIFDDDEWFRVKRGMRDRMDFAVNEQVIEFSPNTYDECYKEVDNLEKPIEELVYMMRSKPADMNEMLMFKSRILDASAELAYCISNRRGRDY